VDVFFWFLKIHYWHHKAFCQVLSCKKPENQLVSFRRPRD
jgi:hypothetical protein